MRIHFTLHPAKAGIENRKKTPGDFLSYFCGVRRIFAGLGFAPGLGSSFAACILKTRPERKKEYEEIFKRSWTTLS